jgi:thiol:disulfide interchange protein
MIAKKLKRSWLMKRSIVLLVCLALTGVAASVQGQDAKAGNGTCAAGNAATPGNNSAKTTGNAAPTDTKYVPVHAYDDKRNAEQDILDAVAEAQRTHKRVLVEVGGLWCIWCRYMDEFFDKQPNLLALREKNFVMVKVNFSDENKNEAVLGRYPTVAGYPHIFVLDSDGKLLHSQDTGLLEEGKSYNLAKFEAFLKQWSAASAAMMQK